MTIAQPDLIEVDYNSALVAEDETVPAPHANWFKRAFARLKVLNTLVQSAADRQQVAAHKDF